MKIKTLRILPDVQYPDSITITMITTTSTTTTNYSTQESLPLPLPLPSQPLRDVQPMLFQCWSTVFNAGPTLNRHWLNILCLMGRDLLPVCQT